MTTLSGEEELHVIPNAGAPGTAGEGFRVVDRTDATDEEFQARVAVFDAAEEPEEVTVIRTMLDLADEIEAEADEMPFPTNWAASRIRAALPSPAPTPRGDHVPPPAP